MAALLGTHEYRDRPGQVPWHSRSALRGWAATVRMTVGCGSPRPLAVRVPRLSRIRKSDRRRCWLAAAAPPVRSSIRHEKRRTDPFPWKIFPLDTKSLMTVRRLSNSGREIFKSLFLSPSSNGPTDDEHDEQGDGGDGEGDERQQEQERQ